MSEAGRLSPPEGMPPLGPPAWPAPPPPPPPRGRRWWLPVLAVAVLAVAIGAVVAVAQLAGDDGDADPPRRSTTTVDDRSSRTTVETPERTASPAPTDGQTFTDPQGTYTITLDPDWMDLPSTTVAEIETWAVAEPADGFVPNVNVLTQAAPGMDQDDYMDLSIQGLDTIDGELLDQAFVTGPTGTRLGLIEYTARFAGGPSDLHFVALFDILDGTAVVATFTAPEDRFDELWPTVQPYLLTLEATG